MPEANQRLLHLARKLLTATQRGDVDWDQVDDYSYEADFGDVRVASFQVIPDSSWDQPSYWITILKSREVVDEAESTSTRDDVLRSLWMAARRRAADVDSIIDDLLNELDSEERPPSLDDFT